MTQYFGHFLTLLQGGLHRGGRGGGRPPNLSIGGDRPPNFGLQYKGAPKSPLLSLFCNSVYWLKPHNVNSRPPNLAVLPPPLSYSNQAILSVKFVLVSSDPLHCVPCNYNFLGPKFSLKQSSQPKFLLLSERSCNFE